METHRNFNRTHNLSEIILLLKILNTSDEKIKSLSATNQWMSERRVSGKRSCKSKH